MLLRTALIFLLMTSAVHAEIKLTQKELLGAWQIDSESSNRDGSNGKKLSSVWTFRDDGTLEGLSTDSDVNARSSEIRAVIQYSVEDGKIIKQTMPGRSKFETCTAVEKNDPKMTLECNHIYFFMTKK